MKNKLLITSVVTACLALPLVGHTADDRKQDRSSPKVWLKDSAITTKIKAELASKKLSSAVHIKVDTDANGDVLLSGNAKTQAEVTQAEQIARNVQGVKSVENKIQVKADL
ncbi:MAG TPA: BON domain-containing protein [Burkholderiales bacterium]|nr:BON domain-containing protein [Burkholderiales bacterium]